MTVRGQRVCLPEAFPAQAAAGWLVARRYGVPARMVADATRARLAGDWLGACAAARFDPRFTLGGVTDQFGAEIAAQVTADLTHLVPDLVRWHLPRRVWGGSGLLEPDMSAILSIYGDLDANEQVALVVSTPDIVSRPQRLALHVTQLRDGEPQIAGRWADRWDGARHLWHSGHCGRLRAWVGGDGRTPFHSPDGRLLSAEELPTAPPNGDDLATLTEWTSLLWDQDRAADAWAAAGVTADFVLPEEAAQNFGWNRHGKPSWNGEHFAEHDLLSSPTVLARILTGELDPGTTSGRRLVPNEGVVILNTASGRFAGTPEFAVSRVGGLSGVRFVDADGQHWVQPWTRRSVDLDLLRFNLLTPRQLHPLVRSALFGENAQDDDYRPIDDREQVRTSFPVRCRGQWHQVGWRDGALEPLSHSPDEAEREEVVRSLGGAVPRCFAVTYAWAGREPGRIPRGLGRLRTELLRAVVHGDADEVDRILRTGVHPVGIRDRGGRTLLHMAAYIDDPDFAARMIAAGLTIDAVDSQSRTPLHQVARDGGSITTIRCLLEAGADVTAIDSSGCTAVHVLRSHDAPIILSMLLAHGGSLKRTTSGRPPIAIAIVNNAPADVIRAFIDAGADPTDEDKDHGFNLASDLKYYGRPDLAFLLPDTAENR